MRRLVFGVCLLAFLSVPALAATYSIPHIHTADDSWETYLLLTNTNPDEDVSCTLYLYDADGVLDHQIPLTVEAGRALYFSLRTYGSVSGKVMFAPDYVTARVGYVASESSGGGTAEFALDDQLHKTARLDMSNYTDLTWAGFALFNGSDEPVTVTPRYYGLDGTEHIGTPFELGARQKRVDYFENELGVPFINLLSVVFETDSPALTAITISGEENEKLLFTRSSGALNTWKVVDRYPRQSSSTFDFVGQAVTDDYVVYAVTATGTAYGFNNLVRCFDKHTGELVWETDIGVDMTATGITASDSGNYIYVFGHFGDDTQPRYAFSALPADTGTFTGVSQTYLDGTFDSARQKKILMASEGNTCLVVMQRPEGLYRILLPEDLSDVTNQQGWDMDNILGDLITDNGQYYLIRTDWNDTDGVYNTISVYHMPYNSLLGGGTVETVSDPRLDGVPTHIVADGGYVQDGQLWLMLKAAIGQPVAGSMSNLDITAADLIPCYFNLDTNAFNRFQPLYGAFMTMWATVTQLEDPGGNVFACVSDWHRSLIHQSFGSSFEFYDSQIIGPVTDGDDFFVTTCDLVYVEPAIVAGASYVVTVRKASFTDFFLNGE